MRNILRIAAAATLVMSCGFASPSRAVSTLAIGDLKPLATIKLGKTADWVAVTTDAVWVGSTGPFAVHRIDPMTNSRVATISVPGEPCAGLAVGFGSLWVPLCGKPNRLAQIDTAANTLTRVINIGPAAAEGGITAGGDSIWLVIDKHGVLARIDPATGAVRQRIKIPSGSYNPLYSDGHIWVTQADGATLTALDAASGASLATLSTGPGPRFLTAGGGAIWTLNQGDGSLTRIDAVAPHSTRSIALGTPGHGGDIAFGAGMVWTTMSKVPLSQVDAASFTLRCRWIGPGGDSLGIGHEAIWLTDYRGGTVARIELSTALGQCAR